MYEKGSEIPSAIKHMHPFLTNEFISSNGNWDFFPIKVRYQRYTLENQPNKPEWDQYFMSRIKEESENTPLIYVDAWFFDWNQDGIEDAFVNASNTFYSYEDAVPNPPFYDKTVIYTISALFLSGNEPFCTLCSVDEYIPKEPINVVGDEGIWVSYNKSKENSGEHIISAIQYDAKDHLIICPVFSFGDYGRSEDFEIILCDIDGDGKAEFITTNIGIYSPLIVYKLIDGKPVEVYRVTTGA